MSAGDVAIFSGIAFIVITGLAARFRMPNGAALMMFVLFVILFADLFNPIYLLTILIIGVFTFFGVARLVNK